MEIHLKKNLHILLRLNNYKYFKFGLIRSEIIISNTIFQFLNLSGDHPEYNTLFLIEACNLTIDNSIVKGARLSRDIQFLTRNDAIFNCTFDNKIQIKNFTVMDTYIFSVINELKSQ